MENNAVIIFVKRPLSGYVKTRLAASIGEKHATELYRCMLADLAETLRKLACTKIICFTPDNAETQSELTNYFGKDNIYLAQKGETLGKRLIHAYEYGFKYGFSNLILIGSDTPHLTPVVFENAFNKVDAGIVVLGPSNDGGYYLLGLKKETFFKKIFQKIKWSTTQVLDQTIQRIINENKKYYLLEELIDIDDENDLRLVLNELEQNSRTYNYIVKNKLY